MSFSAAAILGFSGRNGFRNASSAALLLALAACAQPSQTDANAPTGTVGPNTLNVADAAISGGDPNMALSISQSVLKDDPDNVDALVHEGDAYYALGRCIPAQAAYQVALQYDAKSSPAETGLGRCLLKTDPAAAEQAFIAAVNADPGNAAAWSDLGVARDLQGNFQGAVEPYQKSLLANPASIATEVNLGLSLALSGHGPEALQYLGPLATSQDATPKIRQDYAAALIASGRDDEARQVLAVDLTPDQTQQAMDGFSDLIANSIQNPAPPPPQAPTQPEVSTQPVAAAATPVSAPTPLVPEASVPAPVAAPVAPATAVPTSGDPDAAYSGPSPIPGAVSSSMPGQVATPPAAPAPEVTATAAVPPPATPPAAPNPEPVATPPAATSAEVTAAAPAPIVPPTAPPPTSAPVPISTSSSGSASVQLGALNSENAAQSQWNKIAAAEPVLFQGKSPNILQASVNGQTYYRLRVDGFANTVDAARFCGEVSSAGYACTVANF